MDKQGIYKTIPNEDLIRYLIETYYAKGTDQANRGLVSSHWEYYSGLFDVKVDAQGHLVSLSGTGFGTCKWTGLGHRTLDQLCVLAHLTHLPRRWQILRLRGIAVKVCQAMGLNPTLDVFRQICSLELLTRYIPADIRHKRMHLLMIGDGYGVLSALIKAVLPNSTVVLVDIGKTLLFQAYYCQRAHPNSVHTLAAPDANPRNVDFLYCPTEHLEHLAGIKFDIAVNIVSMQEMNASTIGMYFEFLRSHLQANNLFYCCNRESKTLIGGEVTRFSDYPWEDGDRYLVDAFCPWSRYFFRWGLAGNGPRFLGLRTPIAAFYDGRIVHRLAVLATT